MIGILGGTFDPIHNGHILVAAAVQRRLDLDEVRFVPCAEPVHRAAPRATAAQRAAMIELAIATYPAFRLDSLELDRGGASYTVDTLRALRAALASPLLLILGGDAFNGFARWREPAEILRLANLAVCLRPGVAVDDDVCAANRVDSTAALGASAAGAILLLDVDANDCASSEIRGALGAGQSPPSNCLESRVADYIETHRLYRDADG